MLFKRMASVAKSVMRFALAAYVRAALIIFNYFERLWEERSIKVHEHAIPPEVYSSMRQLIDIKCPLLFIQDINSCPQSTLRDIEILSQFMSRLDPSGLTIHKYKICYHDFETLLPHKWLNDAIMNAFCALCALGTNEKCVFMNSFFYEKLRGQGQNVMHAHRWLTKANAFSSDRIIFPINIDNIHWTVGMYNLKDKRIEYYDSMCNHPSESHAVVFNLIQASTALFNADQPWKLENSIFDTPQQSNTYDCGVFACCIYYSLCESYKQFSFAQSDMDSIRLQIAFNLFFHGGLRLEG